MIAKMALVTKIPNRIEVISVKSGVFCSIFIGSILLHF